MTVVWLCHKKVKSSFREVKLFQSCRVSGMAAVHAGLWSWLFRSRTSSLFVQIKEPHTSQPPKFLKPGGPPVKSPP